MEIEVVEFEDLQYAPRIQEVERFLANQRGATYGSATLDKLGTVSYSLANGERPQNAPFLITAAQPLSYDEETETKSGGMTGALVCWPNDRTVLEVLPTNRRAKTGTALFETLIRYVAISDLRFWIDRTNTPAQQFLLSKQFSPAAMSGLNVLYMHTNAVDALGLS